MSHRSRPRVLPLVAVLAFLPFLAGCGVMFGGTTKTIAVTSAPSAAMLTTSPSTAQFTTPASMELERKNSYTITARKEGYREAQAQIQKRMRTGPLILDILFTGLVGVVIDAATGGWYDLQPENVTLALEQMDPEQDGPDVIEVTIAFDEGEGGVATVESTEAVQVEIVKN